MHKLRAHANRGLGSSRCFTRYLQDAKALASRVAEAKTVSGSENDSTDRRGHIFQLRAMALHGFFNTTARPAKFDLQRRLVGCPTYCDDETSERLHNCSAAFLDEAAFTIRFLNLLFFFVLLKKKSRGRVTHHTMKGHG